MINEIIGKKFNKLTILKIDSRTERKVLVQCECGKIITKYKSDVIHSRSKSCGIGLCSERVKNLTNLQFGYLKVIRLENIGKRGALWKCICDCGNATLVRSNSLISGNTKSCGCLQKITISKIKSLPFGHSHKNKLFDNYKRGAASRGVDFNLSFDMFVSLVSDNCHYCGSEPLFKQYDTSIAHNNKPIHFNGIDRKDNDKGYVIDNCVTACKYCNFAKGTRSYKDFVLWIEKIIEFWIS